MSDSALCHIAAVPSCDILGYLFGISMPVLLNRHDEPKFRCRVSNGLVRKFILVYTSSLHGRDRELRRVGYIVAYSTRQVCAARDEARSIVCVVMLHGSIAALNRS